MWWEQKPERVSDAQPSCLTLDEGVMRCSAGTYVSVSLRTERAQIARSSAPATFGGGVMPLRADVVLFWRALRRSVA